MMFLISGIFMPLELEDSSLNPYLDMWPGHLAMPNHFARLLSIEITGLVWICYYPKPGDKGSRMDLIITQSMMTTDAISRAVCLVKESIHQI
jgi:hypothetical protein